MQTQIPLGHCPKSNSPWTTVSTCAKAETRDLVQLSERPQSCRLYDTICHPSSIHISPQPQPYRTSSSITMAQGPIVITVVYNARPQLLSHSTSHAIVRPWFLMIFTSAANSLLYMLYVGSSHIIGSRGAIRVTEGKENCRAINTCNPRAHCTKQSFVLHVLPGSASRSQAGTAEIVPSNIY